MNAPRVVSHFVPADAGRHGRSHYAVCGALCDLVVAPRLHSVTPTCAACQRWLVLDRVATAQLNARWEEADRERRKRYMPRGLETDDGENDSEDAADD